MEGILHNLEGTKKHVHLLSVVCTDEGSIYEITIERKHFAETLEENIVHYVREELYEDCQRSLERNPAIEIVLALPALTALAFLNTDAPQSIGYQIAQPTPETASALVVG